MKKENETNRQSCLTPRSFFKLSVNGEKMNTFFNLIQPISNLPVFLFLNLSICLIAIHWYWMKSTNNFSEKVHRNLQRIALFLSILIIGILFVKQWNIGDLLAFYSLFSLIILIVALINNKPEIIKESRA